MIIDTHVHVHPTEIVSNWEKIGEKEPYFDALCRSRVHRWAAAEDVISAMDEDGVRESWICGFAFSDLGLCRLSNDYVLDAAARSGGRLKPLIVVPPLSAGAGRELERCAGQGAIGVGELFPDGQGFRIDESRETWRLVGACQEAGLFLVLHLAEPVGRSYPGKGCVGPREAYAFASNHPEIHVVFAHMGGGLFLYEQVRGVRMSLRNVWYDTAAVPFLYEPSIFDSSLAAGVTDKLLFGSDYPLLRYPRYEAMLKATSLASKDLSALFCGNAQNLLRQARFSSDYRQNQP